MMKALWKTVLRIVVTVSAILGVCVWWLTQPTCTRVQATEPLAGEMPEKLRAHVEALSIAFHPRNFQELENLDRTASYIKEHFAQAGARTYYQGFAVGSATYRNVVGVFNEGAGEKLIIGAHYDSCEDTPGADDNASGVAGLIELGYLLGQQCPEYEIELVGYTLEEPPFFRTNMMGSYHHALKVAKSKQKVKGVIVLEMIGYFSDQKGSQEYPSRALNALYPDEGNFIAVISKSDQVLFCRQMKSRMQQVSKVPVYSLNAPAKLPGIDFSDHRNYWPHGFNAVMVTDTAFFRNKNYHTLNDTSDTLDYDKMAEVVTAVYASLEGL